MTAAITKVYKLRTGEGGFSADSADSTDPYRIIVNEQIDHVQVMELFLALPDSPIPKVTTKPFGDNVVICDRYSCSNYKQQRYVWDLNVYWKSLESTKPQDNSSPTPNGSTGDPADWSPVVSRRAVAVQEPIETAFYEGGYGGHADTVFSARTTADDRSPLANSALVPFRDNLPVRQRKQSLWTIKWLRGGADFSDMFEFEDKLNETECTFTHLGVSHVWVAKTALL